MAKPIISPENQPTFLAVTFILVIINLALTMYNFKQIGNVAAFYGAVAVKNVADLKAVGDVDKVADLEKRVAALETAGAPAEAAAAPPAEAAAPAAP
ncbi:MAG: hypothetical protein JXB39_14460 [Deltaproteobacteria bacterium]|nr:hypothetical protein [Deltaproteobacteria bacterium]